MTEVFSKPVLVNRAQIVEPEPRMSALGASLMRVSEARARGQEQLAEHMGLVIETLIRHIRSDDERVSLQAVALYCQHMLPRVKAQEVAGEVLEVEEPTDIRQVREDILSIIQSRTA